MSHRGERRRTDWVVCENTSVGGYMNRCLRCGVTEVLKVPTPVEAFVLRLEAFMAEHRYCQAGTPNSVVGLEPHEFAKLTMSNVPSLICERCGETRDHPAHRAHTNPEGTG